MIYLIQYKYLNNYQYLKSSIRYLKKTITLLTYYNKRFRILNIIIKDDYNYRLLKIIPHFMFSIHFLFRYRILFNLLLLLFWFLILLSSFSMFRLFNFNLPIFLNADTFLNFQITFLGFLLISFNFFLLKKLWYIYYIIQ